MKITCNKCGQECDGDPAFHQCKPPIAGSAICSVATPTIADEIAEYKATRETSAVNLLNRVLDKIIGLKCPHCGENVSITIESH